MTLASNNPFPSILITEGTEPSAPAAGKQRLYIDSTTHHLKRTDSSGTDVDIEAAAGGGSVATDAIWDTVGDLAVGTGANTAAKLVKGSDYDGLITDASTSTDLRWVPGASVLLYDFTVSTDQRAIDTGVDTPAAGIAGTSAFPALRVLEIFLYARSDIAAVGATLDWFFNNDTAANYDGVRLQNANTTVTGLVANARAGFFTTGAGASNDTSNFMTNELVVPNYAGTVGHKTGTAKAANADGTAAEDLVQMFSFRWRSTSAITRVMVRENNASQKLIAGSRLLVYAR